MQIYSPDEEGFSAAHHLLRDMSGMPMWNHSIYEIIILAFRG